MTGVIYTTPPPAPQSRCRVKLHPPPDALEAYCSTVWICCATKAARLVMSASWHPDRALEGGGVIEALGRGVPN